MVGNMELILTAALACTYASGASATQFEIAKADIAETAAESVDVADFMVAAVADSSSVAVQSTDSNAGGWEFALTPYLWASGTKINIDTPQGEEFKVDQSFGDILDDLKFAFMGAVEAKRGRFVSVQDFFYISLGSAANGQIGPIPIDAEADEKLLATTHLFGYRAVDNGAMFVDIFAGGRITSIKVDLEIDTPLGSIHRSSKKTQFGPVMATRFRAPLGGKWGAAIYGDIGGFGIGADLSWQLLGTIQYDLSDRWRLLAGWRHFYAKQSKGDFDVRTKLDGPILGVSYRF